ncbi:MAG: TRIC cation channel family protein [Campylobacter sp.]|nr:TRIC cation channel family protein [Campylobacter sp.]
MQIILFFEYVGIASAVLSGYLFGVKKGCDWLGIFISAFLTGLGGGILRDMMVGRPVYSFTHYFPPMILIVVFIVAKITKIHKKQDALAKNFVFVFTDAIDVVCFSIVGAMVACDFNLNVFGVALIAFFNGVGGGILRDILLNEVPWFLSTGLYGTISIGVGVVYYLMWLAGLTHIAFLLVLLAAGITIRMFAFYRGWSLPMFKD